MLPKLFNWTQELIYVDHDSMSPPTLNSLVGTPVNYRGYRGKVISNTYLSITVRFDGWLTWLWKLILRKN
jgi:hypothetical protein